MIYKTFKIAGQTIKTKVVDSLPKSEYGKFNDAKNLILLAKTIKVEDEIVELTKEQIENSYYHEVIHAFQFYYNNQYDETQAQVFANFICEMLESNDVIEV